LLSEEDQKIERKKRERSFCSDSCRKEWQQRPENIESRINKSKEAFLEKHGVENGFQLKEVQEKAQTSAKKTFKAIGDEIQRKIKKTKLERYGNENFNNIKKTKEKKRLKYGNENFNNRQKAKETMQERFGADHAMKNSKIRKKAENTLLSNHGVKSPLQKKELMDKMRQTNLDRYGVENYSMSQEFKGKVTNTWLKKLGDTKQYQLIQQLKSNNIEILNEFSGFTHQNSSDIRYINYDFKCITCGYEFSRKFCNPTIPICRKCFPSPTSPRTHEDIRNLLVESKIKYLENSRDHIKGYELDFAIDDKALAIELNGNYFHSERSGGKDKNYHIEKTKLTNDKNIKLIHIFEDEIMNKKDIVLSRIRSMTNSQNNSIGARKCVIAELTFEQKRRFFKENHIQGDSPSSVAIGLMYNGEIVSAISLGKPRRALGSKNKKDHHELIRFCNKLNTNVSGSFSRLLSYFKKNYEPELITTYADIRWSGYDPDKTVYAKNGFSFDSFTRPNYWYFKKGNYMDRYHRFSFRKNRIVEIAKREGLLKKGDENQYTEWEIAQMLGMDRIWDCGNMKFVWKN